MEHHIDEQVSAYIDNELHPVDRLKVKKHLQSCEQCNQLVEDLLSLQSEVIASFGTLSLRDNLENKVWEKIKFKRAVKIGVVTFLTLFFILFIVFMSSIGSVVFKLFSIFYKVVLELIYLLPHFIALDTTIMVSFVLFAIMLIIVSGLSLRRIFRTSIVEGDESFG